jgi:hypothetical protein
VREVKEETTFYVELGKTVKKSAYRDEIREVPFYYFIPKSISGKIKLSSEHTEYGWFTKEEIRKLKLHQSVILYF